MPNNSSKIAKNRPEISKKHNCRRSLLPLLLVLPVFSWEKGGNLWMNCLAAARTTSSTEASVKTLKTYKHYLLTSCTHSPAACTLVTFPALTSLLIACLDIRITASRRHSSHCLLGIACLLAFLDTHPHTHTQLILSTSSAHPHSGLSILPAPHTHATSTQLTTSIHSRTHTKTVPAHTHVNGHSTRHTQRLTPETHACYTHQ
jgi:hypothetical protein